MKLIDIGKYILLVTFIIGGAAYGLHLSGFWAKTSKTVNAESTTNAVSYHVVVSASQHRFPLSALDEKDTNEAPDLAVAVNGDVFLTWASKTGASERSVFFTHSTDDGKSFTKPSVVSRAGIYKSTAKEGSKSGGFERRATPHLALTASGLQLAWGEARTDGAGMRMVLATSKDAGTTFGSPEMVHSGKGANPTFTSMAVGPNGSLACAWLDDRAGMQQPYASFRPAGSAAFEPDKRVHIGKPNVGVCPCCPTSVCFSSDGTLYVAFRNVSGDYRDIAVGRLKPGQSNFEGPFPVVADTWKFDGCPHDGPSIVVNGEMIHIVWMDARTGTQRCYYAVANRNDMAFTAKELHPGVPGSQGNAKLFLDASGNLHAVWEESFGAEMPVSVGQSAGHQHGPPKVGVGGGRAVMYAVMPNGKTEFGTARALAAKSGVFQTRPVINGNAKGDLFVTWNELDTAGKAVVITRINGLREGVRQ